MGRDELRYASIAELRQGLHRRRFTSAELTAAALEALERIGTRYNAVATLTRERAMAEAARADARLRRGTAPDLCGIPYGAKDLFAAQGAPTTWGAPAFKDQVFDHDATVIDRLRRRGAVLAAKLAMVGLAGGGRPRHPGAGLHGAGKNPWDPTRYSGGSSSGPGIAVAIGALPYALGTETGGSILGPASYSGITGLRPTYGLVPRTGVMSLSWTLDKVGVLARTAADCGQVLEAIAGPDGTDATSAGRSHGPWRAIAASRAQRVRVGVAGDDLDDCAPDTRAALGAGLAEFQRIAPRTVRVSVRRDLPYAAALETIILAEAASAFEAHLESASFELSDAKQKAELREALEIRARDYLRAMRLRSVMAEDLRGIWRQADVILSASRTATAPALAGPNPKRTSKTTPDRLRAIGNLAGLPGIFFPCGLAGDGLPVGLQLIGPPGSEALLIGLAARFQSETGHHQLRPPVDA